jgi:hypothetical protein
VKWSTFAAVAGAALISLAQAKAAPAPPPAPSTDLSFSSSPHVFLVKGSTQTEIPVSAAQEFMAGQSRGFFFIPKNVTTRMGFYLPGAPAFVAPPAPAFDVNIAGVSWADPAHITPVIIRLQTMSGHEHVIGSQATSSAVLTSVSTIEPLADDRVSVTVRLISKRLFQITPAQPLEPGEYGVAVRDPDVKSWSGKMGDPGNAPPPMQQLYQMYVWPFVVKSAQQ